MKEIGSIIKAELGEAATRVAARLIPDFLLRTAAFFNPELRPFVPDPRLRENDLQ